MRFHLTDEHHYMLELIADAPLLAIPEIDRYTAVLAATKLIVLTVDTKWKITHLGRAVLARRNYSLH